MYTTPQEISVTCTQLLVKNTPIRSGSETTITCSGSVTFTPRLLSIVFFLQPAGDLPEGIIVPPPVNGTDEDYADYIDSQQDSFRSGGPVQANASPDFDNNPDQVGRFNSGLFL